MNNTKRNLLISFGMWLVFEGIAITLWITKDNIFYLLNFSYIGTSITLGLILFQFDYRHARRIVQLLVGMYMLVYLGLICQENMQIEGFWYYLFTGVFEAATIHYAIAKIFGPLLFGRGWCGYACWTAMVLDFLPYKNASDGEKEDWICQIYHFCDSIYFCGSTFLKSHTESGKDYVYSFYCWKYLVLCDRNYSGIPMER